MFKNKSEEYILEVFKDANYTIKNYSKNDIIALEGDICTCVGLILEGSIDIKRTLGTKVIHVSSFTKGHIFGEVIAFSDINLYPATVISASSSKIMFISKDNFIKYCTSHKDFLERFLNDLTNKIFVLNKSITNLTFNSIRQKICNFLITEYKLQKSYNIKLKMTKEKIAESLGITRPSLSRELINMKDEGLDLHIGDMVYVEKGGEIIPKIVGVDKNARIMIGDKVKFITYCPECGSKLVRYEGEAAYYCTNDAACPPQIKGKIEHFISRRAMDIDGLGLETDRKSTRLNSSHNVISRMPSSA